MAAEREISIRPIMASRWRRRRMCLLLADAPSPAALRTVSGNGAFLETNARPPLGRAVELHHPEAGAIRAHVVGLAPDGIALAFVADESAIAFALAAITADMSRPV